MSTNQTCPHMSYLFIQPITVMHYASHDCVGSFQIKYDLSVAQVLDDDPHPLRLRSERKHLERWEERVFSDAIMVHTTGLCTTLTHLGSFILTQNNVQITFKKAINKKLFVGMLKHSPQCIWLLGKSNLMTLRSYAPQCKPMDRWSVLSTTPFKQLSVFLRDRHRWVEIYESFLVQGGIKQAKLKFLQRQCAITST